MTSHRRLAVAGIAVALLGGAASADVVRLRNGDILEGKAVDLGESVQVETASGRLELPWSSVEVIDRKATPADLLAARRAAVKDDDARGLFALALWCERQGLVEEARSLCEKVVALDPSHEAARAALGEGKTAAGWKKGDALLAARGFVRRDGKWLLREEAEAADRRAAAARKASDEEARAVRLLESLGDGNPRVRSYAAEALGSVDEALRRRLWIVGVRHRSPLVRRAAAEGLGRPGDEGAVRSLLRAAVLDSSPEVRAAAAASLKAVAIPEVVHPLLRALESNSAPVRMNAADALGALGDRTVVRTLVQRVHWVAGSSNRANIQVLNQVSYIKDFDVEIAQLAQIGDPIIGLLQDGVILDAKVFGAEGWETRLERIAYTRSLARLTGKDLGDDPAAWARWWEAEGKAEYASR